MYGSHNFTRNHMIEDVAFRSSDIRGFYITWIDIGMNVTLEWYQSATGANLTLLDFENDLRM